MENTMNEVKSGVEEWIEPEICDLDVRETAASSFGGGDGGPIPDCTRS